MAKFSVEEINMARTCVSMERKEMVQELTWLLRHCEGYMKELVAKLDYDNRGVKERIFRAVQNSGIKGWDTDCIKEGL